MRFSNINTISVDSTGPIENPGFSSEDSGSRNSYAALCANHYADIFTPGFKRSEAEIFSYMDTGAYSPIHSGITASFPLAPAGGQHFPQQYADELRRLESLRDKAEAIVGADRSVKLSLKQFHKYKYLVMPCLLADGSAVCKQIHPDSPDYPDLVALYCARKVLSVVRKALHTLRSDPSAYDPFVLDVAFRQLEEAFGAACPSIFASRSRIIENWLSESYPTNTLESESNYRFITANNESVRSKNELIVADIQYHWFIPYKYEYPVVLPDGSVIFVDFKMLNPFTFKEYYLEILGLMRNERYARKNLHRINQLSTAGINTGDNLLLLFDYDGEPLNTRTIKSLLANTVMHP